MEIFCYSILVQSLSLFSMKILIKSGSYRNTPIINQEFYCTSTAPKVVNDSELYFWISDNNCAPFKRVRVFEYSITDSSINSASFANLEPQKSEAELELEISERFEVMEKLYDAVSVGAIKSLIVSGSPGLGKSSSITSHLIRREKSCGHTYSTIKGVATSKYVFEHLRDNAHENHIVLFDDCDDIFFDSSTLNVFKACLESGNKPRIVTWGSSRGSSEENQFEFKGSVVFLTNVAFSKMTKNDVLKSHLQALASRSHYFDVTLDTALETFIRIKQVSLNSDILKSRQLSESQVSEILEFIRLNLDNFVELSLRTIVKIADMYLYSPTDYKRLIAVTCFRNRFNTFS